MCVGKGETAVLGDFPEIFGETGDHGISGKLALHPGFMADDMLDEAACSFIGGSVKQLVIKKHLQQIGQLEGDVVQRLAGCGCLLAL